MNNTSASNNSIVPYNFPMWDDVPRDPTFNVLSFVNPGCVNKSRQVCKRWDQFIKSEGTWQQLSYLHFPVIPLDKIRSLERYFSLYSSFSGRMHYSVTNLPGHTMIIQALILDGNTLFSCSLDKTIKVWDLIAKNCIATLLPTSKVFSLAKAENGTLFSGCQNGTIWSWDWQKNTCMALPQEHTDAVNALSLTKNGLLFSGSNDNTIRIWDTATCTCKAVLKGHTGAVHLLAAAEDGSYLFSGSKDATVRAWNLKDNTCVDIWENLGAVHSFAILQDETLLISSDNGLIQRWSIRPCKLDVSFGRTRSLAVAKTGMLFVGESFPSLIGFDQKTINVWNLKAPNHSTIIVDDINTTRVLVAADGSELIGCALDTMAIKVCDFAATPFEILTEIAGALEFSSSGHVWERGRVHTNALRRFERLSEKIKNRIYGELYEIIKPQLKRDYWGCGQDAFYGLKKQEKATSAQIALAIRNYLKNNYT
jgi:hypothetical protein